MRGLRILAALACLCGYAQALDYPTESVRIMVRYAPGGIADVAARPTLAEAGMPQFGGKVWMGVFGQNEVPDDFVRRLGADFKEALAQQDLINQIDVLGAIAGNEPVTVLVERIKRDASVNEASVRKVDIAI